MLSSKPGEDLLFTTFFPKGEKEECPYEKVSM